MDKKIVEEIFGSDGVLSRLLPEYRPRQGQLDMAQIVYRNLGQNKHCIVEAPTGTGKSLGAGIPAAIWAALEGKIVIYATANKTLQDQLYFKDLPLIKQVIDEYTEDSEIEEWRFGIIKGFSNYLCLQKYEESKEEKSIGNDRLKIVEDFIESTETGDRADMPIDPGDDVWNKVSTSTDGCYKDKCPKYDRCFAFKARQQAQSCHFVVTNYHVLFLDRVIRNLTEGKTGLLPYYDAVIMDEVHEVPDIAMSFRGYTYTSGTLNQILGVLRRATGDNEAKNILNNLEVGHKNLLNRFDEEARRSKIIHEPLGDDYSVSAFLGVAANWFADAANQIDRNEHPTQYWKLKTLQSSCKKLREIVLTFCYGHVSKEEIQQDPLTLENKKVVRLDFGNKEQIGDFPAEHVFYYEANRRGQHNIHCKVLDASDWLQNNIFNSKIAICTSATIATGGKLSFIAHQLGFEDESKYEGAIVGSPFDGKKVLAVIPDGAPLPSDREFQDYLIDSLHYVVRDIGEGGVMGLFTSYRNLTAVSRGLKKRLKNVQIFVQGEMGKRQIIENFLEEYRKGNKALILATASFWQGVDIPGQALSVVFIDKIPFVTPEDPVYWHLDKEDSAAFIRYAVPKALIALKQGVGRLIRRETDYGVIVLCDKRIQTKSYGKSLLKALPEGCFTSNDLSHVIHFLEEEADAARESAQA